MSVIDSKSTEELQRSLLTEIAKAANELRCARGDIEKAQSRLQFAVAVLNQMIQRKEIQ